MTRKGGFAASEVWLVGRGGHVGTVRHMGPEPNRVLVCGDLHGNTERMIDVTSAAVRRGCSTVLHVGDFGWFPHMSWGAGYIDAVNECAAAHGVTWCFIGGNHDNWEHLDELTAHGDRDSYGFVVAGTHLRYIPRPHRWEWHGKRFAALGGAWSINSRQLVAYISWWPDEEPTIGEAGALVAGGDVDVLVCHDAPAAADLSSLSVDGDDLGGSRSTRQLLDWVAEQCGARLVVCGHWHHRWRCDTGKLTIDGLGADTGMLDEQICVLDLTTLRCAGEPSPIPVR